MITAKLNVEGMSCEHCVKAVTNAVNTLPSVSGVDVDLSTKTVTFEHDPEKTTIENIIAAIEDQGYDVVV